MPTDKVYFNRKMYEMLTNSDAAATVDLTNQELNGNDIETLCTAILTSTKTTTLLLGSNNINDAAALRLSAALKSNSGLQTLVLKDNQIDTKGAIAIRRAILENSNISAHSFTLDLSNNLIGLDEFPMLDHLNLKFLSLDLTENFLGDDSSSGALYRYIVATDNTSAKSSKRRMPGPS